ncbi:patatin-like phospholipase family protein [Lachnoclostridium sp. Marseille-P6806]|uniref:patatin-like phospholipase family protein n=1 Tax=Lachnoclostridium sp. Marseille-P6806 TaxID=2364793 RepID=UPI00102F55D6|nr:patatin family protein [Lachnoclostridium sp. Marseille-P6806]
MEQDKDKREKTGLVLEGGAMRGMFTAGVIDVLMENAVDFDSVIGVSAGAAFGCNYKSRQPGRVLRYNLRFARDPRYGSLRSLLRTGDLYNAEFCYHALPGVFDPMDVRTYENNPQEFYVVATDAETGEPVYRRCDRCDDETFEWFRASASLPVAARPVPIGGRFYMDGGIADPIPFRWLQSQGNTRMVAVLTQPRGYRKSGNGGNPALTRLALRRYPKLFQRLEVRPAAYNRTLDELRGEEESGRIFVIAPPQALEIGRIEHRAAKIHQVYEIGRTEGTRQLEAVRRFLAG